MRYLAHGRLQPGTWHHCTLLLLCRMLAQQDQDKTERGARRFQHCTPASPALGTCPLVVGGVGGVCLLAPPTRTWALTGRIRCHRPTYACAPLRSPMSPTPSTCPKILSACSATLGQVLLTMSDVHRCGIRVFSRRAVGPVGGLHFFLRFPTHPTPHHACLPAGTVSTGRPRRRQAHTSCLSPPGTSLARGRRLSLCSRGQILTQAKPTRTTAKAAPCCT